MIVEDLFTDTKLSVCDSKVFRHVTMFKMDALDGPSRALEVSLTREETVRLIAHLQEELEYFDRRHPPKKESGDGN